MSDGQAIGFGDLFGSMWRVFKSNYGIVLGLGFLGLACLLGLVILVNGVGIALAEDAAPGAMGPRAIAFCITAVVNVFVIWPIFAYIGYAILRRGRGSNEPRKAGRYGAIVLISIFQGLFIFPGQVVSLIASPGQFSNAIVTFDGMSQLFGSGDRAEKREAAEEMKADQLPTNRGLATFGVALILVGGLFLLLWVPWANLAVLDPRNDASSAGAALRYGRNLNAPVRGPMYGAWIVAGLICVASVCLFCLPGLFFGFPLFLAAGPGFYMAMRGEAG
jgi:hypothetical protein